MLPNPTHTVLTQYVQYMLSGVICHRILRAAKIPFLLDFLTMKKCLTIEKEQSYYPSENMTCLISLPLYTDYDYPDTAHNQDYMLPLKTNPQNKLNGRLGQVRNGRLGTFTDTFYLWCTCV